MVKLNNLKRDLRFYKRHYKNDLKQSITKNYNIKILNKDLDYFENYSWDSYNYLNEIKNENNNLKEYTKYLEELFNVSNLSNNR